MNRRHHLTLTISLLLAFAPVSLALGQSLANNEPVGGCPDATPEEAQTLGFRQVPIKMPQFVHRNALLATGLEARVGGHATPDFSHIDDTIKTFTNQLPNISNKIAPKEDKELFHDFDVSDLNSNSDPVYAFCYSFASGNWAFTPGVVISEPGDQLNADGRSGLSIPPQTYAVFEYDGPRADIANFRYTLTSRFWPLSTVRRSDSPNFEVYPTGDDGVSPSVNMQLWVAVSMETMPSGFTILEY